MSKRNYTTSTAKSSHKPARAPRARQFAPFSALRGYYDLILEYQRVKEPQREISEERAEVLSYKLSQAAKGMVVEVECYNHELEAYEIIKGIVSQLDPVFGTLTVVKRRIPFDDIWDITVEDIPESPEVE